MDIKTLQYWHKLEHFYPYVIGEQTNPKIKTFTIDSGERFDELVNAPLPSGKAVRYYVVYFGLFRIDKALEALEHGMGRTMRLRDSGDDTSCFCTFTMNANREFNYESFKISSFPWAVHRVRDGKIIIDQWDDDFRKFETDIFLRLNDHAESLNYDFLLDLREWIGHNINWNVAYCDHWMRIDCIVGDSYGEDDVEDEPEDTEGDIAAEAVQSAESQCNKAENTDIDEQVKRNDLLNSFYIRELERIIDSVKTDKSFAGDSFQHYLKPNVEKRIDVEKDRKTLLELLSPRLLPKGRWPSDYGLRLMQQTDVNAFLCSGTPYHQSLFSVNGPPGTGKTTLLKDIIAAIIVERAIQMCVLDMPNDAFGDVICEIKTETAKGVYKNYVRDIKQDFKRYGILIASNNNGAVENVTHTLPSLREISGKYIDEDCYYFSEISDLLFGQSKTWALNAAALGNRSNRQKFADAFWPLNPEHEGYNFRRALWDKTKKFSPTEWKEAKQAFQIALDEVHQKYEHAEEAYTHLKKLISAKEELKTLKKDIYDKNNRLLKLNNSLSIQQNEIERLESHRGHLKAKLGDIEKSQSLFHIKRLFTPDSVLAQSYRSMKSELQAGILELHSARDMYHAAKVEISRIQIVLKEWQERISILDAEIRQTEATLRLFQNETASSLQIDAYFEESPDEKASLSSPWGYDALNECRAKLFIEAMALHKAFVQNSKYLRENLDAFSKMLRGSIAEEQLPIVSPVLLQSFMLMVSVVSTTFASVGMFLRHIPPQEIAYLFIDEAGQAMPQSAIGAIWRARNVIAVGDPLQIEPVVTLHDSVIHALAEHYGQSDVIASKYTSVQSLADTANKLGGFRTITEEDDLWIGAPLVVHNRCQKRVFDIANQIAYNEKMVYATTDCKKAECRWINVIGKSESGHYVPSQAEAIRDIIVGAFADFVNKRDESQKYPSIFVISPFRSVRSGMAAYFRNNLPSVLEGNNIDVSKDVIRKWIGECIGTIHTFQGKEANTVVLCLGVSSDGKGMGAVEWACEHPNILNVAVTRSKVNLYIVGDKAVWAGKPYFKTAAKICE
jgi:predicted  nucleic acid-binding Zn-ribbon protein